MNNLKKIGISALAGSLAAFSANAAEMAVSGSAKLTYHNGDSSEVTGNPYGMNSSIGFSGSGDVNGYDVSMLVTAADQFGGMSSASVTVDLGDMGKVSFDQGVGIGGISTIDDKTPSAYEEVWDGLDAITGDKNGLVGGGNSGVFVYSNTFAGSAVTAQYGKGASAANTDDAVSGTTGASGSSWDFAVTNSDLYEGMTVGGGYGKIANAGGGQGSDDDEHYTAFVTYTASGVTVGYQESFVGNDQQGGIDEQAQGWGVAINLMEGLSASYGEREVEHIKASSAHVTEDQEGFAVAYTMGSATLSVQNNEVSNNGGTAGTSDETFQVALSLSF
jgi:outer membrane protein OmpU